MREREKKDVAFVKREKNNIGMTNERERNYLANKRKEKCMAQR